VAVNHLADQHGHKFNSLHVPRCVYSAPEVASLGLSQQQAVAQGYEVKVGKVPFAAIGKALIQGEKDGFVKIVADAKSNDILGVNMIGPHVTELINEAALAQILDATPWEIGQVVFAHPSLSEIIGEAALAVDGMATSV
jgi:dihydrolipoamide dehydrogenase